MTANVITLARIILAVIVIVIFQIGFYGIIIALILTMIVFYMDSLDGYLARKLRVANDFGALFDITGDRIVENIYWIYFTTVGLVPIWVPIIIISRSFLVDTVRSVAYSKEGKTPFGEKSMMRSKFTLFLTASRFMRALYGTAKVVVFILLGGILILKNGSLSIGILYSATVMKNYYLFTTIIVWLTVVLNLVRGLPVLWDGKYYLFSREYPRELKNAQ